MEDEQNGADEIISTEDIKNVTTEEQSPPETGRASAPVPITSKESLYDRIPLTKKQLDVIIIFLIAAIIIFLIFGALVGNRII